MKTFLISLAIIALILTVPMMFGAIWAFIELEDEERTWREFEDGKCEDIDTSKSNPGEVH